MTFDYIIVGAGSAGCVLANRLTENPAITVLLLEAGPKNTKLETIIPGGYMKLHRSSVDWNCYWTTPQPFLQNRKLYHPRGKVLGGCSATNAMAYVRGHAGVMMTCSPTLLNQSTTNSFKTHIMVKTGPCT